MANIIAKFDLEPRKKKENNKFQSSHKITFSKIDLKEVSFVSHFNVTLISMEFYLQNIVNI